MATARENAKDWALILGASSGFGAATALELARSGMNVFGVHLDLRSTLPNAQRVVAEIEGMGRRAVFFNTNAADAEKRAAVLESVRETLSAQGPDASVRVFLHSLAFGTLVPFVADDPKARVSQRQLEMTLDVMASALVYWVQDLVAMKLMRAGGRVFAMTSSGSTRVIRNYGPVSAAKAALESYVRQLAYELAPLGITVNAIRAGITDTPALRKIPGGMELLERAQRQNPSGRATTPEDAARAIAALCDPRTQWITGNVIGVDGGEDLTA
ncbi:MAG: SDR family oxidoreductase [Dehalococcoidia bacterium]|nr:SDR family oxidoreductase [Dehalococcoidia bacterium]